MGPWRGHGSVLGGSMERSVLGGSMKGSVLGGSMEGSVMWVHGVVIVGTVRFVVL